jgi:hypothetical protein
VSAPRVKILSIGAIALPPDTDAGAHQGRSYGQEHQRIPEEDDQEWADFVYDEPDAPPAPPALASCKESDATPSQDDAELLHTPWFDTNGNWDKGILVRPYILTTALLWIFAFVSMFYASLHYTNFEPLFLLFSNVMTGYPTLFCLAWGTLQLDEYLRGGERKHFVSSMIWLSCCILSIVSYFLYKLLISLLLHGQDPCCEWGFLAAWSTGQLPLPLPACEDRVGPQQAAPLFRGLLPVAIPQALFQRSLRWLSQYRHGPAAIPNYHGGSVTLWSGVYGQRGSVRARNPRRDIPAMDWILACE